MGDIVDQLILELGKRQTKNSEYSMRAFARDLDIDQSLLTKILKRKRKISKNLENQITQKLGYD